MGKGSLVLAVGKLATKERKKRDQIRRSADCKRACTAVPLAKRAEAEAVGLLGPGLELRALPAMGKSESEDSREEPDAASGWEGGRRDA